MCIRITYDVSQDRLAGSRPWVHVTAFYVKVCYNHGHTHLAGIIIYDKVYIEWLAQSLCINYQLSDLKVCFICGSSAHAPSPHDHISYSINHSRLYNNTHVVLSNNKLIGPCKAISYSL